MKELNENLFELEEKFEEKEDIIDEHDSTIDILEQEGRELNRDCDEYQFNLRQRGRSTVDICMEMINGCQKFRNVFTRN